MPMGPYSVCMKLSTPSHVYVNLLESSHIIDRRIRTHTHTHRLAISYDTRQTYALFLDAFFCTIESDRKRVIK